MVEVSIHAPREGCDYRLRGITRRPLRFNSRTPGGVRRVRALTPSALDVKFQFTHPGRGATTYTAKSLQAYLRFNSRTPGGVRPARRRPRRCGGYVSIHAPREGCDIVVDLCKVTKYGFNSRTPGGVRRRVYVPPYAHLGFQFTHPGRGATYFLLFIGGNLISFNSRTPGGVRRYLGGRHYCPYGFQFTHPGRGATFKQIDLAPDSKFQFTHPGRGATPSAQRERYERAGFNSRTPGGVRHE